MPPPQAIFPEHREDICGCCLVVALLSENQLPRGSGGLLQCVCPFEGVTWFSADSLVSFSPDALVTTSELWPRLFPQPLANAASSLRVSLPSSRAWSVVVPKALAMTGITVAFIHLRLRIPVAVSRIQAPRITTIMTQRS